MEWPCKETKYTEGQSCSGAEGRIEVWTGRHHTTVDFTQLVADVEGGNSRRSINFIVARLKTVCKAGHWMQSLRPANKGLKGELLVLIPGTQQNSKAEKKEEIC